MLIVNASTLALNPTVPAATIERAFETDPARAASEYGIDGLVSFRADVESFLSREAVASVVIQGRYELPPREDVSYVAFTDPSGGSADAFTLAIAHRDGDRAALDALREVRPPFSPDSVVGEFAVLLKSYRVREVVGDRYAGEWPRERFTVHGISFQPAGRTKSDYYRELLPCSTRGAWSCSTIPGSRVS